MTEYRTYSVKYVHELEEELARLRQSVGRSTKRIDNYICIDTDQLIIDEMQEIVDTDTSRLCDDDTKSWLTLKEAAKIILGNYLVGGYHD
jgi:hypothetical protein